MSNSYHNDSTDNERNKLVSAFAKFNFDIDNGMLELNASKLLNIDIETPTADLSNEQYDLLADYYRVPRHNEEIITEIFIDNGTLFNDAIEMIMDKLSNQYGYEVYWCDSNDEFLNNNCQNFDQQELFNIVFDVLINLDYDDY